MSVLPRSAMYSKQLSVLSPSAIRRENFCEYAYDFEKNELKLQDGKHYYVFGNEALKIWIYKAVLTTRYRFSAYSRDFGTEIYALVGEVLSRKHKEAEIRRYLIETLLAHPYITEIRRIDLRSRKDGLEATVYYRSVFLDDIEEVSCTVQIL